MAKYLEGWLRDWVGDRAHQPGTLGIYTTNVEKHINPVIGPMPLGKVTEDDVKRMLNTAENKGLSGTTVQLIYDTLNGALKRAVPRLLELNPCAGVERPRRDTKEVEPWTPEQVTTLLAYVRGDRLEALWNCYLLLALRRGEALGLAWGDINWDAGTVTVRQQLDRRTRERKDRKGHEKPVVHVMPARVAALLRARRAAQLREQVKAGAKWTGNPLGLVFTARYGTPVGANWTTERWKTLATRAGLPAIPRSAVHSARHYAASVQYAGGAQEREVQAYLGQKDPTSQRTYVHLKRDANAVAAGRMDALHPVEDDAVAQ